VESDRWADSYIRQGLFDVSWQDMILTEKGFRRLIHSYLSFALLLISTMAPGSTQPLTETSIRNFPGGKKRPARRADTLAAIYEPNV
jgi:hypothetical protein